MKKQALLLTMVIALSFPFSVKATDSSFNIGINNSNIDLSKSPYLIGLQIGHSKNWQLFKNLSLSREYNLLFKQTKLNKKLIWSYPGILSEYDLDIKMLYFEIPIFLEYSLKLKNSNTRIHIGLSLLLCLSGKVNRSFIKRIDDSYAKGETDILPYFDFNFIEDPGPVNALADNSSFGLNIGIQYTLFSKIIELRYTLSKIRNLDAVDFNRNYHTISLVIFI